MNQSEEICPLCSSHSVHFFTDNSGKIYRHCKKCSGVFLASRFFISQEEELARYKTHNNIVSDVFYQDFVQDLTDLIKSNETKNSLGLDFGCGPGPVIQYLLIREGYHLLTFDPYFQPDKKVLKNRYQYIVSCEVIEHFNSPYSSFLRLKKLLRPGGRLYLKTDILYEVTVQKFKTWGYRQDPTHVFFYTPSTFEYIKQAFNYSSVKVRGRTVVLQN